MAGLASLLSFLQAAGAPPEATGKDINVLRKQDAAPRAQPPLLGGSDIDTEASPLSLDNRRFIEQRDEAAKKREEFAPRKGMFGIKGTLRDVLGALSDNYLMQGGQKPQYQAMREQERLQDAMAGFTQMDPRAVAENLAGVDRESAVKFYDMVADQRAKSATQEGLSADRTYKRRQDFGNYAARLLSGAKTPEQQAYVLEVLGRRAKESGIDLADILGTEGPLDEAQRTAFATGDMTVNQQQQLPIAQERAKIAREALEQRPELEAMKEKGRMARDNPPSPRGISNVDAEVAEAILSGKATPAQIKYYNERLKKQTKKNRFSGSAVPPALKGKEPAGWGKMSVK